MSLFTKKYLESRLANELIVDSSKIKEIRTWLIGNKLHFQAIVRIWFKELVKSRNDKKLAFMYLAYDVIWHSIKDCPEFVTEFGMYMKKVFEHLVTVNFDEKAIHNIGEFIKIWRKKQIFDEEIQGTVEKIWKEGSVDDITVVKEIKKEKGGINQLPPHLTCSVCSGLLKEPVQLPCCKTALCKLCAFAKLEQHNTCWFGFCPKSVVIRKDEVHTSPELAIQVDLWKTHDKERFKENDVVKDLEAHKNVDLQIIASTEVNNIKVDSKFEEKYKKSSCESTYTDAKGNTRDSKTLSAVASGTLSKPNNNPYIVDDSASDDLSEINNIEDFTLNDGRNGNAGCLLKWINPTGEKEQCTVPGKDSPMRDAVKRRLQCDEEGTKSKMVKQNVIGNREASGMLRFSDAANVKMCKQNVNDNREASEILRIPDAANVKEKTITSRKGYTAEPNVQPLQENIMGPVNFYGNGMGGTVNGFGPQPFYSGFPDNGYDPAGGHGGNNRFLEEMDQSRSGNTWNREQGRGFGRGFSYKNGGNRGNNGRGGGGGFRNNKNKLKDRNGGGRGGKQITRGQKQESRPCKFWVEKGRCTQEKCRFKHPSQ